MGEEMMGAVSGLFEGDDANNPMDVAQTFVDLINMPNGQRPLRTAVGKEFVLVEALNAQSIVSQGEMMDFYGLGKYKSTTKAA